MTTIPQICNLALAHLGNQALVTSISPLDGSMEAQYCAVFYPQALNVMMAKHAWSFATVSQVLQAAGNYVSGGGVGVSSLMVDDATGIAAGMFVSGAGVAAGVTVSAVNLTTKVVTLSAARTGPGAGGYVFGFELPVNPNPLWNYAYALPVDVLTLLAVRFPWAMPAAGYPGNYAVLNVFDQNVEFAIEEGVLFCNADPSAVLVYVSSSYSNTALYPALFVEALSWLLASYLAGPLGKLDVGAAMGQRCLQFSEAALKAAVERDCVAMRRKPVYVPLGLAARV